MGEKAAKTLLDNPPSPRFTHYRVYDNAIHQ